MATKTMSAAERLAWQEEKDNLAKELTVKQGMQISRFS